MEIKSFNVISEQYFENNNTVLAAIPDLAEKAVLDGIEKGESKFEFLVGLPRLAPLLKERISDALKKAGYHEIIFQEKVQGPQNTKATRVAFKAPEMV